MGSWSFQTPMLFVLGAISIFLIGGLTGPPNGTVTTDLFLHDTYWIVGHFHATMFGGFMFPFVAALYYWYPKVTGRMYNETLGKGSLLADAAGVLGAKLGPNAHWPAGDAPAYWRL